MIPRILHQTYSTAIMPDELEANVKRLRHNNPDWDYRFYSDSDVESFIKSVYGKNILEAYLSIDKRYGAARADLFRYLVIYKEGGVYLDIKSNFQQPIDNILSLDEGFIVSQWSNRPGEKNENVGMHPQLADISGGEFQQWHVIGASGHPFLRAVIERVLANIDEYRPWANQVGFYGVLRLTGPIVYTRTIAPLLGDYPCKIFRTEEPLALEYSACQAQNHQRFSKTHYSKLDIPIVHRHGMLKLMGFSYLFAKRAKQRISSLVKSGR